MISIPVFHRLPTEEQMQEAIAQLVKLKHGRVWHLNDARRSPEMVDFWDTTVLLPPFLVCVELKSQRRPFESVGQEQVAAMLADCRRMVTGVVRPEPRPGEYSYDELLDVLRGA